MSLAGFLLLNCRRMDTPYTYCRTMDPHSKSTIVDQASDFILGRQENVRLDSVCYATKYYIFALSIGIISIGVSLIWKILEFSKSMILFLKFWLKIFGKLVSDFL